MNGYKKRLAIIQKDFLLNKLSGLKAEHGNIEPRDVVLYGFGRIGRLAARELIKQAGKGQQLRLKLLSPGNSRGRYYQKESLFTKK